MEVTEQDVDYVMAVLELRHGVEEYPNEWYETREQQREQLRLSAQCGNWPVREYRAVAAVALAARTREVEEMREENGLLKADLAAVRKVAQQSLPYGGIDPFVYEAIMGAIELAHEATWAQRKEPAETVVVDYAGILVRATERALGRALAAQEGT